MPQIQNCYTFFGFNIIIDSVNKIVFIKVFIQNVKDITVINTELMLHQHLNI